MSDEMVIIVFMLYMVSVYMLMGLVLEFAWKYFRLTQFLINLIFLFLAYGLIMFVKAVSHMDFIEATLMTFGVVGTMALIIVGAWIGYKVMEGDEDGL